MQKIILAKCPQCRHCSPVNQHHQMKEQIAQVVANLQENIARLEATVRKNHWQKGYVANCKEQIASYKQQVAEWESKLAA